MSTSASPVVADSRSRTGLLVMDGLLIVLMSWLLYMVVADRSAADEAERAAESTVEGTLEGTVGNTDAGTSDGTPDNGVEDEGTDGESDSESGQD